MVMQGVDMSAAAIHVPRVMCGELPVSLLQLYQEKCDELCGDLR